MSRAVLFSLSLLILAGAAHAAASDPATSGPDGLTTTAETRAAAAPSPCAGCAGSDCANCPMAMAAAGESVPAAVRCSAP
ncbi:MAG TPA: hypothetical protein VIG55_12285 [Methylosinus sp.]|jgi:hypothetical protein